MQGNDTNKQIVNQIYRELKADQLGVNVHDLSQVFQNGKTTLVNKSKPESYFKNRTRKRTIRGSGSVIENINNRLTSIEQLIKDLEEKGEIVGLESFDLLDQLMNVAEKTESIIHPLLELENDIETQKKQVPNFKQYYQAHIEIVTNRQQGYLSEAEELEQKQDKGYREFRLVYRSILPLLHQTRELRCGLLKEERRLLNLQYTVMGIFLGWQVQQVMDLVNSSPGDTSMYNEFLQGLNPWKKVPAFKLITCKNGTPITKQIQVLETDIQKLSDQIDDTLPTASEFINRIYELLKREILR
jgi:hypothetical protein